MTTVNREFIGPGEAIILAVVFISAKIFLTFQTTMTAIGLSAAWMVTLIAVLLGVVAFLPLAMLMHRFPGRDIVEIGEELLGPYINLLLFTGYFIFLLAVESMVLRQFAERTLTVAIPEMPISVAIVGLVLGAVIATYMGLEAISRTTKISFIFVGLLFFLVMSLTYPFWDISNLTPVLGPGAVEVLTGGISKVSIISEIFILAVIYPSIRFSGRWKIWNVGFSSLLITGIIMVAIVLVYTLMFPVPVAREMSLPTFEMARLIFFGSFVQRLEPVFLPMWELAALLKLTIGLYAMVYLLARFLKLPYYRPLILPVAIILTSVSFIPVNVSTALEIDEKIIQTWGWVPVFGGPLFLLVVAVIRRKGEGAGENSS